MEIRTRSNVFSRRVVVIGLASVALLGGTVAVSTCASASPHHANVQQMPKGFHYRYVWHQIDDCGRHNAGQRKVIIWKGSGDKQSALFCPDGTVWPS